MKTIILLLVPFFGISQVQLSFQNYISVNDTGKLTHYSLSIAHNDTTTINDDTITIKYLNKIIYTGNAVLDDNSTDTMALFYTNELCKNIPVVRNYIDTKFNDSLLLFHSIGIDDNCEVLNNILRSNNWVTGGFQIYKPDTTKDNIDSTISLIVDTKSFEFNIYPNPASRTINVDYGKKSKLTFTDIQGKNVLSYLLSEGKNTIDISELNKGVYFIRLEDQLQFQKLIVQ